MVWDFRQGWKKNEKRYYINEEIRAKKILLIDEDWQKKWLMSLDEALRLWQEQYKDVIQIWYNPNEWIVTAKLMEVWKFLYTQKKIDKEKKKNQKSNLQKEVKFWYNIWENDLNMKKEKIIEFLEDWNSVKVIWQLRWRENYYKSKMYEKVKLIEENLSEYSKSQWVREEKNWYSIILLPKSK